MKWHEKPKPVTTLVTKDVPNYLDSAKCVICTARLPDGTPIRDDIDAKFVAGLSLNEIVAWAVQRKAFFSVKQLDHHLKTHSAFISRTKKELTRIQQILVHRVTGQKREADSALDRIISTGDRMIENWEQEAFHGQVNDGPKMPVTDKLYIEALKEQGRRKTVTRLDDVFALMEQSAIIQGEEVTKGTDDPASPPKSLPGQLEQGKK